MITDKEMEEYIKEVNACETFVNLNRKGYLDSILKEAIDRGFFKNFEVTRVELTENKIVFEGKTKGSILPRYSLKETYIITKALKDGYFDEDSKSLESLAGQLELNIDETKNLVDKLSEKLYTNFIKEFIRGEKIS